LFQHTVQDYKPDISALSTCPTKHNGVGTFRGLNKSLNNQLSFCLLEFEESLERLKIAAQKSLSEDSESDFEMSTKNVRKTAKQDPKFVEEIGGREVNLSQFINPLNDSFCFGFQVGTEFKPVNTSRSGKRFGSQEQITSALEKTNDAQKKTISDEQVDLKLKKNADTLTVNFRAIKKRWSLQDVGHKDAKCKMAHEFVALKKKNMQMYEKSINVQDAQPEIVSAHDYDEYFCKHLEDSCSQNFDGLSSGLLSSKRFGEDSQFASDCVDLIEKKSDQASKATWENADWLCKPRNYGTTIDLISNH